MRRDPVVDSLASCHPADSPLIVIDLPPYVSVRAYGSFQDRNALVLGKKRDGWRSDRRLLANIESTRNRDTRGFADCQRISERDCWCRGRNRRLCRAGWRRRRSSRSRLFRHWRFCGRYSDGNIPGGCRAWLKTAACKDRNNPEECHRQQAQVKVLCGPCSLAYASYRRLGASCVPGVIVGTGSRAAVRGAEPPLFALVPCLIFETTLRV